MNFAQMGGLDLLMKDLNHTKEEIRQDAAFVLGSASQRYVLPNFLPTENPNSGISEKLKLKMK